MAEFRWKHLNKEQIWDTFLNSYRFVIGGNPYIKLESYELPFLHASSLRINEALLISALRGYVPFSDSIVHDRMMHRKVNRTLQLVARDHGLREKLEIEISTTLPYQHLSLAVLNRLVPDAELEKRSLSELVEYRNENESHLHRMRVALGSLAAELKVGDPGRDYYRAIQNLVESKVLPEIVKVREELVRNYEVAFGKLGIQSAQVTIPTLVATVFGGLGLWEVLGACALAELGMLAAKGADQLLDLWRARRISGRGAYCYLTEFGA